MVCNSSQSILQVGDLHGRVVLTNDSMHKTVYSFNGHIIYVQVHTNIYGTSKYETKSRSQRADVYVSWSFPEKLKKYSSSARKCVRFRSRCMSIKNIFSVPTALWERNLSSWFCEERCSWKTPVKLAAAVKKSTLSNSMQPMKVHTKRHLSLNSSWAMQPILPRSNAWYGRALASGP